MAVKALLIFCQIQHTGLFDRMIHRLFSPSIRRKGVKQKASRPGMVNYKYEASPHYFPCSISYHRSFLFLCVNPFLPNSVIADGELRLIDIIVEASAADVQLEADRCDIVCTDLVVLERALGNSVFHGSRLPGLHGPAVGAVIHHEAVHRGGSHCIADIDRGGRIIDDGQQHIVVQHIVRYALADDPDSVLV